MRHCRERMYLKTEFPWHREGACRITWAVSQHREFVFQGPDENSTHPYADQHFTHLQEAFTLTFSHCGGSIAWRHEFQQRDTLEQSHVPVFILCKVSPRSQSTNLAGTSSQNWFVKSQQQWACSHLNVSHKPGIPSFSKREAEWIATLERSGLVSSSSSFCMN